MAGPGPAGARAPLPPLPRAALLPGHRLDPAPRALGSHPMARAAGSPAKPAGRRRAPRPAVAFPASSEARAALLACVSPGAELSSAPLASLVARCDPDELVTLAAFQGVAGRASGALQPLLPSRPAARLLAQVRRETMRHLMALAELSRFGAALDAAAAPWVVLKGPALTELAYRGTCRFYSDLDLMVAPARMGEAVAALQGCGLDLREDDLAPLVRGAKGQLGLCGPERPTVDLHWHLLYKASARRRYRIRSAELLERRRQVQLGHTGAWVLEPTDFAAHIALHAAQSGAHRLRWLLDIERTLTNQPPDWDSFVQRCRAWRVGLPVSVALQRAAVTLAAPVPEGVVAALAGSYANRALVHELGKWAPAGHLPGGRSVVAGLTRSVRDTLSVTAGEMALEVRDLLARLAHPPASNGATGRSDPGLRSFLDMVDSADEFGRTPVTTGRARPRPATP